MKKNIVILGLLVCLMVSCFAPSTFVKTNEPTWSTIQLRDSIPFDQAWGEVLDVIAKRFEMEMISKEGGYLRTGWIHTWSISGTYSKQYRVRVIAKFSADKEKVEIKTEAQHLSSSNNWLQGYDTRLLETIKTDVMGVVGRTTR